MLRAWLGFIFDSGAHIGFLLRLELLQHHSRIPWKSNRTKQRHDYQLLRADIFATAQSRVKKTYLKKTSTIQMFSPPRLQSFKASEYYAQFPSFCVRRWLHCVSLHLLQCLWCFGSSNWLLGSKVVPQREASIKGSCARVAYQIVLGLAPEAVPWWKGLQHRHLEAPWESMLNETQDSQLLVQMEFE